MEPSDDVFKVAPDKEISFVFPDALINSLLRSTLVDGVTSIDSEKVIVRTPVLVLYVADEKHGKLSMEFPVVGTVPEVVPGMHASVIKPLLSTFPPAELLIPVPPVFAILIVPLALLVTVPLTAPFTLF